MNSSFYTSVGPKVYVLGGYTGFEDTEFKPCSDVCVLDCRSHMWERGPSMLMPHYNAKVAVVDGEVYVVGGRSKKLWVEFLDPEIGRWEAVPGPLDGGVAFSFNLNMVDGMISVGFGREEFRLDLMSKTWVVLPYLEPSWATDKCVVMDGVSYKCSIRGKFERLDERIGVWKELEGVMEGKLKYLCQPILLNLEGRLVLLFAQVRLGIQLIW